MTYSVKYKKARIRPFKAYGMYRGAGSISVSHDGLHISGRHVLSLGARWGIGLAIFIGSLIATSGKFVPGGLLIYLIMDFVLLKREDIVVSYPDIINYLGRPKQRLVAIDYKGSKWCTPVVLKSEEWSEIVAALRAFIPDRDASSLILPPLPIAAAIRLWVAAFIVYYVIFMLLFVAIMTVIISILRVPSISEIQNGILRVLAFAVTFGMPLLLSILFSTITYKSKRRPSRADGEELPSR